MLEPIYSEPSQDEIIKRLEADSRTHFKCSLDEFIRKLDAQELPEEKRVVTEIMCSRLKAIHPDNAIFQSRRHQLSAAS